ncbi:hypothetical protein [cyanobacterium endosymbiont of Epithemia clementina EcSB]|nr:hypothetical protein [cyanobacterium endosymbiont of Epithemia clementina EcSB]WGT67123.1 hypothetical protein P3F56_07785 [cyanobacterium endosymbiont of Epithemia clementina EcSB]
MKPVDSALDHFHQATNIEHPISNITLAFTYDVLEKIIAKWEPRKVIQ